MGEEGEEGKERVEGEEENTVWGEGEGEGLRNGCFW